jgi:tetratricopeptide (TPR) repeat protein
MASRSESYLRHARHYLGVLRLTEDLFSEGDESSLRALLRFDGERPQIELAQARCTELSRRDSVAAVLCAEFAGAGVRLLDLRQSPFSRARWLDIGVRCAQAVGDRETEGNASGNLGIVHARSAEFELALECFRRDLAVARQIGDRASEGKALGNIGIALKNVGDLPQALDFCAKSLALANSLNDRREEARAWGALGTIYVAMGDVGRAAECFERDVTAARECGDYRARAMALCNLGNVYSVLGQKEQALACYREQLEAARLLGDSVAEGAALFGLAGETRADDFDAAIEAGEAALVLFTRAGSSHADVVARALARWVQEAGDAPEGRPPRD